MANVRSGVLWVVPLALISVLAALSTRPAARTAAADPAPTSRPAGPDAASLARAEKLIRSLYRDEYAARDAPQRQALARKLFQQGLETRDDAALRWVLMRDARDFAANAGDAPTAVRAIDELAKLHPVAVVEMKLSTLAAAARVVEPARGLEPLVQCALALADQCAAADEYDLALRAATLAETHALRHRNPSLAALAQERLKEVHAVRDEFARAGAALQLLQSKPDDDAACGTAGRFLCFAKNDWDKGLPLLVGGTDAALKALADREVARPTEPAEHLRLGHDWWDVAEQQVRYHRGNVQSHAALWYGRALPNLSGANRALAAKRLDEVEIARLRSMQLAPGLRAELFHGKEFARSMLVRVDPQVLFDWGTDAPADGLPKDNFSIRWTGRLRVPAKGKYTFIAYANMSVRLTLGDRVVLNDENASRKTKGARETVELSADLHPFRLDYTDGTGIARMKLHWIPPGAAKEEPIPASAFVHDPLDAR